MTDNIIAKLLQKYASLTKSQKNVADYVLEHQMETQYMTITDLGKNCNVAESTLTYFCKALGCGGFNEFKLLLAKSTLSENTFGSGFEHGYEINTEDSFQDVLQKLYCSNVDALNQTKTMLDENSISAAVDFIIQAENVFCFGQGTSSLIASEMWGRFAAVTTKVHWIQDSHLQAMTCSLLNERSVIVYFSYSAATRELMGTAKLARECGTPMILVTHFHNAPAVEYAKVILLCGSDENPISHGSVVAKIAQLFVIDVLFREFCRRVPQEMLDAMQKTATAVSKNLL